MMLFILDADDEYDNQITHLGIKIDDKYQYSNKNGFQFVIKVNLSKVQLN